MNGGEITVVVEVTGHEIVVGSEQVPAVEVAQGEMAGEAARQMAAHLAAADPHPQYAQAGHGHASATSEASGFMAAADKAKLDGIQARATANATDAELRDRSTHTGTQPIASVAGLQAALDAKLDAARVGAADGVAPLGPDLKVPAAYLPAYVDDVLEFADRAAFPATGESGKIYVSQDTGLTWRWSGSTYVEISPSPGSTDAVPEGAANLYFTDARARAAAVQDTIVDGVTDRAPSQNAVADALAGKANSTHQHSLADLAQSGATPGQVPQWNGSAWVPAAVIGGAGVDDSITDGITDRAPSQNAVFDALAGKADSGHSHSIATSGASGFMSSTDKAKLDGIATNATNTPLSNTAAAALATSASAGSSTSAARSDHVHPYPTPAQIGAAAAAHTHTPGQVGIYVQQTDPGAVPDGSLWIW